MRFSPFPFVWRLLSDEPLVFGRRAFLSRTLLSGSFECELYGRFHPFGSAN